VKFLDLNKIAFYCTAYYNSSITTKVKSHQKLFIFCTEMQSLIEYDINNSEIESFINMEYNFAKLSKSDYYFVINELKVFSQFKFISDYEDEQKEICIKRFSELNLLEGKLLEYQQFDQKNDFVIMLKKFFNLCVKNQIHVKLFDFIFFNIQILNYLNLKIMVRIYSFIIN